MEDLLKGLRELEKADRVADRTLQVLKLLQVKKQLLVGIIYGQQSITVIGRKR